MITTAVKNVCVLWTVYAFVHQIGDATEEETFFSLDLTCQGQVVSSHHCHITVGARSRISCVVQCSRRQDCVYSVWDSNHDLCRLCPVAADDNCTNTEDSEFLGFRNVGKVCCLPFFSIS